jgi:hypothetical protein
MKLDLQSLFGPYVHSCTHWLSPRNPLPPPPPNLGSFTRALLASQEDIDNISLCNPLPDPHNNENSARKEVEEEDEENWLPVPSKECVPLWPLYGGRNYVCRVAGTREATVPFSALDPNPSLLMLANKYGGIDVRSKLDSAQVESWETKIYPRAFI